MVCAQNPSGNNGRSETFSSCEVNLLALEEHLAAIERYRAAQMWQQITAIDDEVIVPPEPLGDDDAARAIEAIRRARPRSEIERRRLALLRRYLTRHRLQIASQQAQQARQRLESPAQVQEWARLTAIIQQAANPEQRRAAWKDLERLSETREQDLVILLNERNARAHALGFSHYGQAILAVSGLQASKFFGFCRALKKQTEAAYRAILTQCQRRDEKIGLKSWHLPFLFRQQSEIADDDFPGDQLELCLWKLVEKLGFDPLTVRARIKVQRVASLPQGLDGLCVILDIPHDIRAVILVKSGYHYYEILFHEFGHALHKAHVKADSFMLRWEEAECFNEGMAYVWQSFLANEEWLRLFLGHTPARAREIAAHLLKFRLLTLRYAMAQAHFEYLAYQSPADDLRSNWLKSLALHMSIDDEGVAPWGANPALVYQPLWTPSYITGSAIASQIYSTLHCEKGTVLHPGVASLLVSKCYRPGATLSWRQKIKNTTGRSLGVASVMEEP